MQILSCFVLLAWASVVHAEVLEIKADPDGSAKLYVPCTFDGVHEKCFLDTGATDSNVKYEAFKTYAPEGQKTVGGLGGDGHRMDWVVVNRVEIAGVVHEKFRLLRWPEHVDRDTFAGIDLFKDLTLKLDFSEKQFHAGKFEIPPALQKFELQTLATGQPSFPVVIGNLTVRGIWDTGAGVSAMDEEFIHKHPEIFKLFREDKIGDSSGKQVSIKVYIASELVVGGRVLKDVVVYGVSFAPFRKAFGEKNIFVFGYNVISQMNWYVDLKTKTWAVY